MSSTLVAGFAVIDKLIQDFHSTIVLRPRLTYQTTDMCWTVLVAKKACQWGHINEVVACWQQCWPVRLNRSTDLYAHSIGKYLKEDTSNIRADRLCDSCDEDSYTLIKTHAVRKSVDPYSDDCCGCTRLECAGFGYAGARDDMEYGKLIVEYFERLLEVQETRILIARDYMHSDSLLDELNDRRNRLQNQLREFRNEYENAASRWEQIVSSPKHAEVVTSALKEMQDKEIKAWNDGDIRRILEADPPKPNEDVFVDFPEGEFNAALISES